MLLALPVPPLSSRLLLASPLLPSSSLLRASVPPAAGSHRDGASSSLLPRFVLHLPPVALIDGIAFPLHLSVVLTRCGVPRHRFSVLHIRLSFLLICVFPPWAIPSNLYICPPNLPFPLVHVL